MNLSEINLQITELLTLPPSERRISLVGTMEQNMLDLCRGLLKDNALYLALPPVVLQTDMRQKTAETQQINLTQPVREFTEYFGNNGDFYCYVEIEARPHVLNEILITENLPDIIKDSNEPKAACWGLTESLFFILKAIIDYVKKHSLHHIHFVLTDFRFKVSEFSRLRYYTATKRCLGDLFDAC